MKAAVVTRNDDHKTLQVLDVPVPEVGPHDVLVSVARAGVCGSDTHGFLDSHGTSRDIGLIMGHEIGGTVARVGEEVEGLALGQRVHVDPQVVCGQCRPCKEGWISICDNKGVLGSSLRGFVQGAMAEYVVADYRSIHPLPDSVTDDQAPLIEPLSNALHVLHRLEVSPDQNVLVLGAGPLGLCMIEAMRAAGIQNVIVSETSPLKRSIAQQLGAIATIDPAAQDLTDAVRDLGLGEIDISIEAVGIETTYRQAIALTRKRGRIGFFGAVVPEVSLPLLPILHKELTIVGCTGANDETAQAIDLLASGRVSFRGWPIEVVGLSEAEAAIRGLANPQGKTVKVLVDPSQ